MQLESAACTYTGRRAQNEDAAFADTQLGLFAVADGMGGRAGGEVASHLAIGAVADVFRQADEDPHMTFPLGFSARMTFEEGLVDLAVRRANQAVYSQRSGLLAQMGTTLALLLIREGFAILGHVGDSRIYRLRKGGLSQLTRDHSLYDELLASGATDLPPRAKFPFCNVITRCLGDLEKGHPDLRSEPLQDGDVFLLCTDGLIECLSDERIAQIMAQLPPEQAGLRLVREAYANGGRDNITAVVVKVERLSGAGWQASHGSDRRAVA